MLLSGRLGLLLGRLLCVCVCVGVGASVSRVTRGFWGFDLTSGAPSCMLVFSGFSW